MGLRTRRGTARAGSNLGHFPAQFEPNSTTLYIIRRRPPTAPPLAPIVVSLPRTPSPTLPLSVVLKSQRDEFSVRAAVRGKQSAGRTYADKIDFLSLAVTPRDVTVYFGPAWTLALGGRDVT